MSKKGSKQIKLEQRKELSRYLQQGMHKKQIADLLNCNLMTIYREISRGSVNGKYDPEYSERRYRESKKKCGKQQRLLVDIELAKKISDMILNEGLSPERIIEKLKTLSIQCPSKGTIYAAIDKGLIPYVTRESLHKKTTTMFSKGLVMIPSWMREKLEMKDGDILNIQLQNRCIVINKVENKE